MAALAFDVCHKADAAAIFLIGRIVQAVLFGEVGVNRCLLYTSDAADDLLCVDLGGRRIIKNKNRTTIKSLSPSRYTTDTPTPTTHLH